MGQNGSVAFARRGRCCDLFNDRGGRLELSGKSRRVNINIKILNELR
jgi:hypothetical protein